MASTAAFRTNRSDESEGSLTSLREALPALSMLDRAGMISSVKKEAFYLIVFLWLSWSLGLLAASHGHSPFPLGFS